MRLAMRSVLLLAVFCGVGLLAARAVMAHASPGTPVAEVRLSAGMGGLFAGGAATLLVLIALLRRRSG
jgi:hypothetical protein